MRKKGWSIKSGLYYGVFLTPLPPQDGRWGGGGERKTQVVEDNDGK